MSRLKPSEAIVDRLRRDAERGALLGALRIIGEALAETETRTPALARGGILLRLHADGSGAVELADPDRGETPDLFLFENRRELVAWLTVPDADRVAIEAAEVAARDERERADDAKLALLFAKPAGGAQ